MGYPEDRPSEEYAVKEARKSRLPLAEQDKAIAEQNEIVSMLLDRLQPVLTPQPESPNKELADRAAISQSEVAEELSSNNARIRRNTNKLSNALDRLEV